MGSPESERKTIDFKWNLFIYFRSDHEKYAVCKILTVINAGIIVSNGKKRINTGKASTIAPKPVVPCTRFTNKITTQ